MLFNIYAFTDDFIKGYNSTDPKEFIKIAYWLAETKQFIKGADSDELKQFDVAINLCLEKAKEVSNE